MGEWKEYKLGDVCTISSSKRIFASEYQKSGIPFYRGKEIIEKQNGISISNELFISEERFNEIRNKYGAPKEGDMLLSSVGTLGVPYIVQNETFYFKDGNLTWFYDYKNINNYFLYYWFLSPQAKFLIDTKAIGSTQKALTIETLKKFEILLPSLSTQNKIVSILKSLDDKIEVNRKICENLEQQAQALFKHWFIDFAPFKDGKFINSELGLIPEGWRVGTLGDYCVIRSGFAFKSSWWQDEGVKVVKIKNITDGGTLDMSDCSCVSEEHASLASSFQTKSGDLLIAMTGATMGKFCVVHGYETYCVNQRVGKFFLGDNPLDKLPFIYCILKRDAVYKEIVNKGQGSAQPNISGKDIEEIKIIFPPKSIIEQFNEELHSSFKFRINSELESRRLATLRDTLLPKLMSGELKVNEL